MNKLRKKFIEKYGVSKVIKPLQKDSKDLEKEAAQLALKLNAVFVVIPMLKPYGEDVNKVKLLQEHLNIILDVLNTSNQVILGNQFYNEVKNILQKVLEENEKGIILNDELLKNSRMISKFSNSLQGKEYWEEKSY